MEEVHIILLNSFTCLKFNPNYKTVYLTSLNFANRINYPLKQTGLPLWRERKRKQRSKHCELRRRSNESKLRHCPGVAAAGEADVSSRPHRPGVAHWPLWLRRAVKLFDGGVISSRGECRDG